MAFLAAALAWGGGCSTGSGPAGSAKGGRVVERLDLLLTSVAVNLDGKPGPDGFGARIYASSRKSAAGVTLVKGRLEIQMFDGLVRGEDLMTRAPLRAWSYDASELKPYLQKTSVGVGYRFLLAWGEQRPRESRITIVAKFTGPDGAPVYAAPGNIPLAVR